MEEHPPPARATTPPWSSPFKASRVAPEPVHASAEAAGGLDGGPPACRMYPAVFPGSPSAPAAAPVRGAFSEPNSCRPAPPRSGRQLPAVTSSRQLPFAAGPRACRQRLWPPSKGHMPLCYLSLHPSPCTEHLLPAGVGD